MEVLPEKRMTRLLTMPHNTRPCRWWLQLEHTDGTITVCKTKKQWQQACRDHLNVVLATAIYPDHQGAAIWVRPDLARGVLAKSMRDQHGIRTIAEVDDNYLTPSKFNLSLRATGWDDDGRMHHMKAVCSQNAVVFSTELLRDTYLKDIKQRFGRLPLEIYVCRNNVMAEDWPERVERNGPVRVGWMGSPSHLWDVDLAWPALRFAKELGAETWMVGYSPVDDPLSYAEQVTVEGEDPVTEKARFKIDQWRKVGFNHIPWRQPAKYERFALPLDIGLCPLLTDRYTLGKSDIKAIEYTISGAAVVAQNNAVYNRTWIHGETALLAGSPREMLEHTALLIRDPKLRERLVANAQQYVREHRGDKQLREEWNAAIAG